MKKIYWKYHEVIFYLIFGLPTLLIYFVTDSLMTNFTHNALLSVTTAQSLSILFAYISNKLWVFKKAPHTNISVQFLKFISVRLIIAFLDLFVAWLCVDKFGNSFIHLFFLNHLNYQNTILSLVILKSFIGNPFLLNNFIWRILIQIIGNVFNYFYAKIIVFKTQMK